MNRLFNVVDNEVNDKTYTKKINIPHYEPSETKPDILSLYNAEKYGNLINEINMSDISDEEKVFLRLAASRHIVFNYAKIADYYAHASVEMQALMEKSALVILDVDDAIANGYVRLSSKIRRILEQSGEIANEK